MPLPALRTPAAHPPCWLPTSTWEAGGVAESVVLLRWAALGSSPDKAAHLHKQRGQAHPGASVAPPPMHQTGPCHGSSKASSEGVVPPSSPGALLLGLTSPVGLSEPWKTDQ